MLFYAYVYNVVGVTTSLSLSLSFSFSSFFFSMCSRILNLYKVVHRKSRGSTFPKCIFLLNKHVVYRANTSRQYTYISCSMNHWKAMVNQSTESQLLLMHMCKCVGSDNLSLCKFLFNKHVVYRENISRFIS